MDALFPEGQIDPPATHACAKCEESCPEEYELCSECADPEEDDDEY